MTRALHRWLPSYLLRPRFREMGGAEQPLHVFIAVCDHFEPFHGTDKAGAMESMHQWAARWPDRVREFRDSSGRGPRHTFFYPVEQYDADVIDVLAEICRATGSEVEVHLHHQDDTSMSLEKKLRDGVEAIASHGLLSRSQSGDPVYGFIHGNWALDHSHPEGKHCGVPDELAVLRRTGCYADFTLPSAPDPAQTRKINAVYYAKEDGLPRSHEQGVDVAIGRTSDLRDSDQHLLLVQGPLGLNWRWRKRGIFPRVENGDLTRANPPTMNRFQLWSHLCPRVAGGPPWVFVKLHTHGGISRNYEMLLGDAAADFHRKLAATNDTNIRYHYVTAREMVNLIHAAESGITDGPEAQLNFRYPAPT